MCPVCVCPSFTERSHTAEQGTSGGLCRMPENTNGEGGKENEGVQGGAVWQQLAAFRQAVSFPVVCVCGVVFTLTI